MLLLLLIDLVKLLLEVALSEEKFLAFVLFTDEALDAESINEEMDPATDVRRDRRRRAAVMEAAIFLFDCIFNYIRLAGGNFKSFLNGIQ